VTGPGSLGPRTVYRLVRAPTETSEDPKDKRRAENSPAQSPSPNPSLGHGAETLPPSRDGSPLERSHECLSSQLATRPVGVVGGRGLTRPWTAPFRPRSVPTSEQRRRECRELAAPGRPIDGYLRSPAARAGSSAAPFPAASFEAAPDCGCPSAAGAHHADSGSVTDCAGFSTADRSGDVLVVLLPVLTFLYGAAR